MGLAKGPKGPSAEEVKAQKEEQRRLEEERKNAELQADRERELRIRSTQATRQRALGRSSLIGTSELGTKGSLG